MPERCQAINGDCSEDAIIMIVATLPPHGPLKEMEVEMPVCWDHATTVDVPGATNIRLETIAEDEAKGLLGAMGRQDAGEA